MKIAGRVASKESPTPLGNERQSAISLRLRGVIRYVTLDRRFPIRDPFFLSRNMGYYSALNRVVICGELTNGNMSPFCCSSVSRYLLECDVKSVEISGSNVDFRPSIIPLRFSMHNQLAYQLWCRFQGDTASTVIDICELPGVGLKQ